MRNSDLNDETWHNTIMEKKNGRRKRREKPGTIRRTYFSGDGDARGTWRNGADGIKYGTGAAQEHGTSFVDVFNIYGICKAG